MSETHILERKCQTAALAVSTSIQHRCAVTVISFYKAILANGWGFASPLAAGDVITTIEATVARKCGAPLPPKDPDVWLPDTSQVKQLAEQCRDALPFSCGFILIIGAGVDSVYASFEEAPRMLEFMSHVVLPALKAQQLVALQAATEGGLSDG
jgi:hypothetical protein